MMNAVKELNEVKKQMIKRLPQKTPSPKNFIKMPAVKFLKENSITSLGFAKSKQFMKLKVSFYQIDVE